MSTDSMTVLETPSESRLADRYEALFRVSQAIAAHRVTTRLREVGIQSACAFP